MRLVKETHKSSVSSEGGSDVPVVSSSVSLMEITGDLDRTGGDWTVDGSGRSIMSSPSSIVMSMASSADVPVLIGGFVDVGGERTDDARRVGSDMVS